MCYFIWGSLKDMNLDQKRRQPKNVSNPFHFLSEFLPILIMLSSFCFVCLNCCYTHVNTNYLMNSCFSITKMFVSERKKKLLFFFIITTKINLQERKPDFRKLFPLCTSIIFMRPVYYAVCFWRMFKINTTPGKNSFQFFRNPDKFTILF